MALGLNFDSNSGDIMPIIKYDARAGRMFRIDREDGVNTPEDITDEFKAVFDFENVETGWIDFQTGGAPIFTLSPFGTTPPPFPGGSAKPGVRVMLRLAQDCGNDVRELATTAKAALRGIDALHTAYMDAKDANPGKLPVVAIEKIIPIISEGGGQKTTNYSPIFVIIGWTERPKDLIFKAKNQPKPQLAAANGTHVSAPATGSTKVPPPSKKSKPAMTVVEGDFG
jgi:hypothetical protein